MITREPEPLMVAPLFAPMRQELLRVLGGLRDDEWALPTACVGWSVKDVALHLLGDDVGLLSRRRDGFLLGEAQYETFEQLVAFINLQNDIWLRALRRMSPAVLLPMLELTGGEVAEWALSLDPQDTGTPVDWIGSEAAPVWLELAREYTEYWAHHQHICDAVGVESLRGDYRFTALAAYTRSLLRAYADVTMPAQTTVQVTYMDADAHQHWYLMYVMGTWRLLAYTNAEVATHIGISADSAWRLFTRGISREAARAASDVEGDRTLAVPFFDAVAILA